MSVWKQVLLNLYFYSSYPQRAWQNAKRCTEGRAPAVILFYHRIADDRGSPWTASNALFQRQMNWLGRHFEFVSLAEVQRRLRCGTNDKPCVTITFDDGYADNCQQALPYLIERRIPCTYFVSSHHILAGKAFGHDLARGRPMAPNTPEQIKELADAGIDIGAHTRTHADLGQMHDPDALFEELVVARQELQELTGTPIRYFAFPFGQHRNMSQASMNAARSAGYAGVCSAYGGFNFPGDDPFHLQRIHVDDDMIRLKNWVTVDPRKLRSTQRFQYDLRQSCLVPQTAGAPE